MDGINIEKKEVVNRTFTYTTGVAIGRSHILYEATGQKKMTLS